MWYILLSILDLHILQTAGILFSGIDMETFKSSFSIALEEFEAFIAYDESPSPVTPLNLVQLLFAFAFSVNYKQDGVSPQLTNTQQKLAMEACLDIFNRLLRIIHKDIRSIGLFLLTGQQSKKFGRIAPLISLFSHWIQTPTIIQMLKSPTISQPPDLWILYADILNAFLALEKNGQLASHCPDESDCDVNSTRVPIKLPEMILVSPFFDVFPREIKPIIICHESFTGETKKDLLALHGRLAFAFNAARTLCLDNGLEFIQFNENFEGKTVNERNPEMHSSSKKLRLLDEDLLTPQAQDLESLDDIAIKKQLIESEERAKKQNWTIEVRPKYLVTDTNCFVEHLNLIKAIVDAQLFILLVPTTVAHELKQLSLGALLKGFSVLSRNQLMPSGSKLANLMESAKISYEFLKDISESTKSSIRTVTTSGNVVSKLMLNTTDTGAFANKTNDDKILESALEFCKKNNGNSSGLHDHETNDGVTIKRNVVLLTEDRGLAVKAIADKIPIRTLPDFVDWIGIGKTGKSA